MSTEIIFAQTSHVYESYLDMRTLIELSEFPMIKESEIDISRECVYICITMNGDVEEKIKSEIASGKQRNAHIILWNLERPSGSEGAMNHYNKRQWQLIHDRFFDETWVSDRQLANESGLRFVVLGSDERLGSPGTQKVYSFCHMSYAVPRRQAIYSKFKENEIGQNCWPPDRDGILQASKFALNVHQDNNPFQEPLRLALFAAYGLPIVTESIFDSYPWSTETMIYANYIDLARVLHEVLDDEYSKYREMGERARDMMTKEFQFGKVVRAAIAESADRFEWR